MTETHLDIAVPTPATLKRYGLSVEEWKAILERQGGACGACAKVPSPSKRGGMRRLNIDHEHVRGWKRMKPEDRQRYVRGLACYMCNSRRLSRGANVANLEGAARYLREYEERRRNDS